MASAFFLYVRCKVEARRILRLILALMSFAGSVNAFAADLPASCNGTSEIAKLALYVDRYPYSTIRLDQPPYLTTAGLNLAIEDMQVEGQFTNQYLRQHGMDTTASKLLRSAEDNAAVAVAERHFFSNLKPSLTQLRALYNATSPTLSDPPSAHLDYYFLRKRRPNQTSEPLSTLYASIADVENTSVPLFHRQLTAYVPGEVTSGTVQVLRGKINPAIETRAFQLPLNSPTLFEGEHGWYILSVRKRQSSSKVPTFESSTATLHRKYMQDRRNAKEAEIRQRVTSQISVTWATTGSLQELIQNPHQTIAAVGERKAIVSEFLEFVSTNGFPSHLEGLEKALHEYLFRLGIVQLAEADGLTSSCLYGSIRDLAFKKALAVIWLQEQLQEKVQDPTSGEIKQRFKQEQSKLELPEQYAVMDIWTTTPSNSDLSEPDQVFLTREKTRTRMKALRDAMAASGFESSALLELDRQFGPFVVQDYGFAPQGPRGYLLDTAVAKLEVGEFSPVVEDAASVHFYLLKAKTPPRPMELHEAVPRLKKAIRSDKLEAARQQLLQQAIIESDTDVPGSRTLILDAGHRDKLIKSLL